MSEQDKAFPSEVVFELEADPSYRIVASNGAMVGPTSRGEIKIDFFVESAKLPTKTINRLTAEHGLGEIISQEPDTQGAVFVRRLQVGLLLTISQARELIKTISEKADTLEQASVNPND